jgi:hypothetical protein
LDPLADIALSKKDKISNKEDAKGFLSGLANVLGLPALP